MTYTDYLEQVQLLHSQKDFTNWLMNISESYVPTKKDIKQRENYVNGCQSWVWITGSQLPDGRWVFDTYTETLYGKALCKIITDCINNQSSEQILAYKTTNFAGLIRGMSKNMQRGFQAILNKSKQIVDKQ